MATRAQLNAIGLKIDAITRRAEKVRASWKTLEEKMRELDQEGYQLREKYDTMERALMVEKANQKGHERTRPEKYPEQCTAKGLSPGYDLAQRCTLEQGHEGPHEI